MRGFSLLQLLTLLVLGAVLVYGILMATGIVSLQQKPTPTLAVFVSKVHVHGVPYGQATSYPASAVPLLLTWLADPTWEQHWTNIVVTACLIGPTSSAEVNVIIAFIERSSTTPISPAEFEAKRAAVKALGYVAHQSANPTALNYLLNRSEPSDWTDPRIDWISPYGQSKAVLRDQMAKAGVMGLGFSGRPGALTRLEDLRDNLGISPIDQAFRSKNSDLFEFAITTHGKVKSSGLQLYLKH